MLHWHDEGTFRLKYGFNFYRPSDSTSSGFILKLHPRLAFKCRYSKLRKKWFVQWAYLTKVQKFMVDHCERTGEFITEKQAKEMMI